MLGSIELVQYSQDEAAEEQCKIGEFEDNELSVESVGVQVEDAGVHQFDQEQ